MLLRVWCKLLLLVVGLGLYGLQAATAEHHVHGWGEPKACASCILHQAPTHRPAGGVELPLPAPVAPPLHAAAVHRDVDPPPALVPEDVSPATSPPLGPCNVE